MTNKTLRPLLLGAVAAAATAALAVGPATTANAVPVEQDVHLVQNKTHARMVPTGAGTANGTIIRVWPDAYSGDLWDLRARGVVQGTGATFYEIYNVQSERCVQPQNNELKAKTLLVLHDCNEHAQTQDWLIESVDTHLYQFVPLKKPDLGITLRDRTGTGSYLEVDNRSHRDPDFDWQIHAA
jgi:hypothetical protein